jgi:hypothetical protein
MNEREIQLRPYVAMPRDALNSAAFCDPHLWHLLCWLQGQAAYRDGPLSVNVGGGSRVIQLKKGQVIVGRNKTSTALGMPPSTFRDRLAALEKLGEVTIQPDNKYSIVTLSDYWSCGSASKNGRHPDDTNGRQVNSVKFTNDLPNEVDLPDTVNDTLTTTCRQPADTKKKGKKGNNLRPPPPTSSPNWLEVEEGLKSCGVASWQGIEQRAVITAMEALESIEQYRERVGSWKPGGLWARITTSIWPPADPNAEKRFRRASELRERLQAQGIEKGASSERIAAVVARALVSKGLEEFVREEERQAQAALQRVAGKNQQSFQESNA